MITSIGEPMQKKEIIEYFQSLSKKERLQLIEILKQMNTTSDSSAESILESFYFEMYNKKFGLGPEEKLGSSLNVIKSVIQSYKEKITSEEKLINLLKKAIVYYLFVFKNEGYPIGLKYLFNKNNEFVLRQCIQNSIDLDIENLDILNSKLDSKEIARTLKRGDSVSNIEQLSKEKLRDDALKLVSKLKKQNAKSLPIIKEREDCAQLFNTTAPSIEYSKNAILFLTKFTKKLNETS